MPRLNQNQWIIKVLRLEEVAKITAAVPDAPAVKPAKRRKLLVFSLAWKYRHSSIPYFKKAVEAMAAKTGAFEVVVSDDVAMFEPETLKTFDAVVFNNTNNEIFLPENVDKLSPAERAKAVERDARLKRSLVDYLAGGGGLAVTHAGVASFRQWPEYGNIIGARFQNHPWRSGSKVTLKVDEPDHPVAGAFTGGSFTVSDEIYQMKAPYSREKLRVLLSVDTGKTNMKVGGIRRTDGDFAISWIKRYGKGRVFYCALGHDHDLFWNPTVLQHYLDGIQYALGDLVADATPAPAARPATRPASAGSVRPAAAGSYAVLVSKATYAEKPWRAVVEALVAKYRGDLVVHSGDVTTARSRLSAMMPNYVCFVARPAEADRPDVAAVHRLMRSLDDDPYTDAMWGILTGYEAADALRIAREPRPLIVRRAVSGTSGVGLGPFDSGVQFAERKAGLMRVKDPGGAVRDAKCPADSTATIVKAFNTTKPDCFFTSGHATTRDWQIGYSYKDGQFRCKGGQLYGLDLAGKRHDINSPNPKVYLPVGNCLIGQIPDRECMALAWMHTGGVNQMIGYTVLTWYGYGGWGVRDLFSGQGGRFTLAEAFYFNNQALVHRLATDWPKLLDANIDNYDLRRDRGLLGRLAVRHGLVDKATRKFTGREGLGLLWDRDTVAFYGDPAWRASLPPTKLPWEQGFTVDGETVTFTVKALADGTWPGRPLAAFLPYRAAEVKVLAGEELAPVITDNFILLPLKGTFEAGQTIQVTYRAAKARPGEPRAAHVSAETEMMTSLPQAHRPAVTAALDSAAADRRAELLAALGAAKGPQRTALAFLIANMPPRDLRSLPIDQLVENVALACRARTEAPWSKRISEAMFLNDVLPYAVVNERRDRWRADFRLPFKDKALKFHSPGAAAVMLNREVFEVLKVKYHATKGRRPNQGPLASAELGWASCTGLSILLIDACRAVGIPARMAGIPQWPDGKGNHNWVEVWDDGWHVLGAAESTQLDKAWFDAKTAKIAKTNPTKRLHRIYATSFRKTDKHFPLAWAGSITYVPAVDVTAFYAERGK